MNWKKLILLLLLTCGLFSCSTENEQKKNDITMTEKDTTKTKLIQSKQYQLISEKINQNPQNAELYFARGNLLFQQNNLPQAIDDLKSAMKIDSLQTKYYQLLSEIYLSKGEVTNAINTLHKCVQLTPDNSNVRLTLGKLHFYIEDNSKALININDALKINPNNAEAYFWKGMIYKEQEDTAKAISSMQTAIDQDPDYYDAYMQLGLMMSNKKNKIAAKYLDNALRIDSNSIEALYAKGMYLQNNKDYENAKSIYKKIILKDQQHSSSFYNLGYIYYFQDSIHKASRLFDMAVRVQPDYAEAVYMRGLTFENLGDKKRAQIDYRQALNLNPDLQLAQEGIKRLSN